jgi:hypothetical protein
MSVIQAGWKILLTRLGLGKESLYLKIKEKTLSERLSDTTQQIDEKASAIVACSKKVSEGLERQQQGYRDLLTLLEEALAEELSA